MKRLTEEIIAGRRIKRGDDLSVFMTADIGELCRGADEIRKALCGDKAELCSIINGRSGSCSEDCKFCAQSSHYHTKAKTYSFRSAEKIIEEAHRNREGGIHRFSIVTSGRGLEGDDWEQALAVYSRLSSETDIKLCASHGFQSIDEFRQLKNAGVQRYHANIETSKRYFPFICTTHTYDEKIKNIRLAQEAGLEVCSGGIIGMGETWEDRLDMAVSLAELNVISIPLNILRPIEGTPFEHLLPLSDEDILRTVAVFRYINPTAWIRIAAGRARFGDNGAALFRSGVNAAISGDMLTTVGSSMNDDVLMFRQLGYRL